MMGGVGYVYKITVSGTSIVETYEVNGEMTEEDVKNLWLSDVKKKYGAAIAQRFKNRVEVKKLTERETAIDE